MPTAKILKMVPVEVSRRIEELRPLGLLDSETELTTKICFNLPNGRQISGELASFRENGELVGSFYLTASLFNEATCDDETVEKYSVSMEMPLDTAPALLAVLTALITNAQRDGILPKREG